MQYFKFFNILVNLNFIINTSYVWNGLNTLKLWVENLQIGEAKPCSLWSWQDGENTVGLESGQANLLPQTESWSLDLKCIYEQL